MLYSLTLHLKAWWKYLQEVFFFTFLRPVLQLHTYKTCLPALKAEALLQELSPQFQKSHIIECFFNMVAVSKHLGTSFRARPSPTVGSGWSKKKKKKRKRHLKLNLKMCFSWKPGRAAVNRGRHFHAPHFSWFLSEFPPFLPRSTVTYCCTGCRPRPAGHQSRQVLPLPQRPSMVDVGWMALTMATSLPGQHDLRFLSPPFTNNAEPENSGLMADSNQPGA